jgi:hypothetical protein
MWNLPKNHFKRTQARSSLTVVILPLFRVVWGGVSLLIYRLLPAPAVRMGRAQALGPF